MSCHARIDLSLDVAVVGVSGSIIVVDGTLVASPIAFVEEVEGGAPHVGRYAL